MNSAIIVLEYKIALEDYGVKYDTVGEENITIPQATKGS